MKIKIKVTDRLIRRANRFDINCPIAQAMNKALSAAAGLPIKVIVMYPYIDVSYDNGDVMEHLMDINHTPRTISFVRRFDEWVAKKRGTKRPKPFTFTIEV